MPPIVCSSISVFLIVFSALSCIARTAIEDFPVKFPPLRTGADFEAHAQLKADRKLTSEEIEKRDLLIQLLLDKDATKIPLPEWQEKDNYRWDFVIFRRQYAAELLGSRIAHKSAIPILVKVAKNQKKQQYFLGEHKYSQREQEVLQKYIQEREVSIRIASLQALSRIADKAIIPHLIDFLATDLHGHAIRYLQFLLDEALQKQYQNASQSRTVSGFFGYQTDQSAVERQKVIQRLKVWWQENQKNIVIVRSKTLPER